MEYLKLMEKEDKLEGKYLKVEFDCLIIWKQIKMMEGNKIL